METTHRERLLTLADLLDTVPTAKFDLGRWHNGKENCQTVACAVGWATTIPEFRRAGLSLDERYLWPVLVRRGRRNLPGFHAAEEFFGLTDEQAAHLFSSNEYESGVGTRPKTVARRIRKLVEAT